MMRTYDPNPDVNELLVYSGAGESMAKRKEKAEQQRFERNVAETTARVQAEWAAAERRETRENRIMFASVFLGLPALGLALVLCLAWCGP